MMMMMARFSSFCFSGDRAPVANTTGGFFKGPSVACIIMHPEVVGGGGGKNATVIVNAFYLCCM